MFKAVKILFLATVMIVAFGAMPVAKHEALHNKAPDTQLVKQSVAIADVNAAVMQEAMVMTSYQVETPEPNAAILMQNESYEKSPLFITLKPPSSGRSRYLLSNYDYNRELIKWKDIHRKHLSSFS